jgi:hypothetical protein
MIIRTILCEEYRSLSSSLCSFLHSPVSSSLLRPNIPLSTLFSNTLSPRSELNVSDYVSHPYKIIIIIIIIIINVRNNLPHHTMSYPRRRWEDNIKIDIQEGTESWSGLLRLWIAIGGGLL